MVARKYTYILYSVVVRSCEFAKTYVPIYIYTYILNILIKILTT